MNAAQTPFAPTPLPDGAGLLPFPQGIVFSPSELLPHPTRAQARAFGLALRSRLLLRLAPGLYVATRPTKFGLAAPSQSEIIESLRARTGQVIVPTAAWSANALGLSTQVPVRPVYWTNGPEQSLMLGKLPITLRHQSKRWLLHEGPEGDALRALEWMGEELPLSSVGRLNRVLPSGWRRLAHTLASRPGSGAPAWVVFALA